MRDIIFNVVQSAPIVFTEVNWRDGYDLVHEIAELYKCTDSNIEAEIITPMVSPKDKEKAECFKGVHITVDDNYIQFDDLYVMEKIISQNEGKVNKQGFGLITQLEALNVTAIPLFTDDTNIRYFNELAFFANINIIKQETFKGSSIEEIDLSNIITVQNNAFTDSKIRQINGSGNKITVYGSFINCYHLEKVNLKIDHFESTSFKGCYKLKSFDLTFCDFISYKCFMDCYFLETITLSECTAIGGHSFTNSGLNTLVITNGLVSAYSTSFNNCPLLDGIYVPDDLVSTYKAADGWSTYASKIKPLSTYKGEL